MFVWPGSGYGIVMSVPGDSSGKVVHTHVSQAQLSSSVISGIAVKTRKVTADCGRDVICCS